MHADSLGFVKLIRRIFTCRTDIFATRWEKSGKSGYMPAVRVDPYRLRLHIMKGGSFKEFSEKEYRLLNEEEIEKHLTGEQFIGIYPLLKDNTSAFIVADFDGTNWAEQCRQFIQFCSHYRIPAYLERSRSGNGGHVWIFFEALYPAFKSRRIMINLLQQSGIISLFDKTSSYDRLFPNQDTLSGKGFGNLIALPFNKISMNEGNCSFIDPVTLIPFSDQYAFVQSITRLNISELDSIFKEISDNDGLKNKESIFYEYGKTVIRLIENVYINRSTIPLKLINYLRDELNFANSEYFILKNTGKSTFRTKRYFKLYEEIGEDIVIPRGLIGKLLRFCKDNRIAFEFKDERKKLTETQFSSTIILHDYQSQAFEAACKKDFGVIVAPPGSGKTVIGLKIVAEKNQPTLILVHRKQLADQWIERIQTFLGIPKQQIGFIGQGKMKPGMAITVAIIQSLVKEIQNNLTSPIVDSFGTIIVDECHHIPAETYRNVISKLNAYYLYGLTATPFRKYNDGKLIFTYLGEIISEIRNEQRMDSPKATIVIRDTKLDVPFNPKTDRFETLSKILIHDNARNRLILDDIALELDSGKRAVIITERKEHIDSLYQYLKNKYETISLSGDDSETKRIEKWKLLKEGNYQVLITTGQFFGEGIDLQTAQCLFLAYPFSFEGKLIQYIGRIQRGEVSPWIYDYRDPKIDYLERLFLKRNSYYRKLEHQATLFDSSGAEIITNKTTFRIEEKIKIPFESLEFGYGVIRFRWQTDKMRRELQFEIENDDILPEFDVLKPYFIKILRIREVKISIYVEFHEGRLISQMAESSDLSRINKEIVESVKFRFIEKRLFDKNKGKPSGLITLEELQGKNAQFFDTELEFLNEVLNHKKVKHFNQLRYLASHHESNIMKVRFVLSPFSFVFLLSGEQQFHIILETLDTEEATYIWHIEKSFPSLKQKLKEIDSDLNQIHTIGRQGFLDNQPKNFSRIMHDYSDDKKGFILWKANLEHVLT